ncbi:MAG: hypothetical protein AB8B91_24110 [Rubripirellula sp.]
MTIERKYFWLSAAVTFTFGVFATIHSHSYSVQLTFCGASLSTDEGAIAFQLPLVRRAVNQPFITESIVYRRRDDTWWAPSGARKCPLAVWMTLSDKVWFEGGSIGKLGYWKGSWQDASRPGPFVVVFAPIWLVALILFAVFALAIQYRLKWSLRLILCVASLAAICLWLLTLKQTNTVNV